MKERKSRMVMQPSDLLKFIQKNMSKFQKFKVCEQSGQIVANQQYQSIEDIYLKDQNGF